MSCGGPYLVILVTLTRLGLEEPFRYKSGPTKGYQERLLSLPPCLRKCPQP